MEPTARDTHFLRLLYGTERENARNVDINGSRLPGILRDVCRLGEEWVSAKLYTWRIKRSNMIYDCEVGIRFNSQINLRQTSDRLKIMVNPPVRKLLGIGCKSRALIGSPYAQMYAGGCLRAWDLFTVSHALPKHAFTRRKRVRFSIRHVLQPYLMQSLRQLYLHILRVFSSFSRPACSCVCVCVEKRCSREDVISWENSGVVQQAWEEFELRL
ncbi:hypothetical protein CEXT_375801 [Caerostris extrusa]|uniref:Uncharacterized protein n=1 Tax=Caerostris extrusa TaxID=172846 RepID=A0AAV4XL57_CAEEX|nr:hypothetical protein CEXT_375801 [Caerostris extrusa]